MATQKDLQTEPLLVDVQEFADLLNISRSTLFSLVSAGRIGPQPIRLGRRRLYRRIEVVDWVAEGARRCDNGKIVKENSEFCR